jgi:ribonuclease D
MQKNKLLTKKEEINFFLNTLVNSKIISIDIEFMRRNTFFPEPCVIQISDGNNHGCIDLTLEINYKEIFKNIFDNNKIIVLHSCRQDLEILYMLLGYIPKKIFDTQFAASFLGYKYQIGYAEVMKEIFQIEIDKTEKMTNWKKRPLTENQIKYALNDVIYLNNLHDNLEKKLVKSKKNIYFKEEFKNYLNDIDWEPETDMAWKRIKSINGLGKIAYDAAKIISVWRERKAIDLNLPRNWILSEKEIIEVSKNFSINNKINLPKKNKILDIDKESSKILYSIKNISTKNENINAIPQTKIKNNIEYKKIADDLYEYYKMVALKNNISYQIVSPKKMILSYLKNNDKNSRLINGWRKNLIDINKITEITKDFFHANH